MKKVFLTLCVIIPLGLMAQSLDERVETLLQQMTLQEKIALIHAQSKFSSAGIPRLGVPELWCTDGPHGIRPEVLWDAWEQAGWTNDSCTAFPALTCLAATWNPQMAHQYGNALGEEALYRRKNVVLGPGVNIYRTPLNGRNFEYMGEDPCLTATMVVPYIQGLQEKGVSACVKHFALNDQEYDRHRVNVTVSDRALYELYLPAFKAAVQNGHTWTLMGAYNRYDGQYTGHNHRLLVDILRDEWNYDGVVVSDWGGTQNTEEAIHNGLDLEFGTWTNGLTAGTTNAYDNYHLAQPYLRKILSGEVDTEELDTKVRHVLKLILRTAMNPDKEFGALVSQAHKTVAREIADEGIVLLQNENKVLPLKLIDSTTILVVGENAIKPMTVGGGSSSLKVKYEISPLQGIQEYVGTQAIVKYARGYVGDTTSEYNGVQMHVDLTETRSAEELTYEATEEAKKADYVIFIGGLNKAPHQDAEEFDRLQYELPYGQNELLTELCKVNKKVIFVGISGNAYAMPWHSQVAGILQAWYGGSEAGHALADVLFGEVNPSGKLPFTIMPSLQDYPAHQYGPKGYPGVDHEVEYFDDIFVGYRYADLYGRKKDLIYTSQGKKYTIHAPKNKPLYPFGFGLSYTTFTKSTPKVVDNKVFVEVTNTGSLPGKEVVQLYISPKKSVTIRPKKELKAFEKVLLQPGETKTVVFELNEEMYKYFDASSHQWVKDKGPFEYIII